MQIHFIGIGGIGMSALARYYFTQGDTISGSDLKPSEITEELEKLGLKIVIGPHRAANVPKETKRVIHTAAVFSSNPELQAAKRHRVKRLSYAEALGELTRQHKTITISGSHGKSTTTALSALVMAEGCYNPTVIIGTKLKEFGNSNFRQGRGPYLVLEADEYNRSFLHYSPHIAIVTNIDAEHLDTYGNVEEVERTFAKYLRKVPPDGYLILNHDDLRLRKLGEKFNSPNIHWYSLADRESDVLRTVLRIPGEHNLSNALAALKLGRILGIHEPVILKVLSQYDGAWRRFEFKGILNGAFLYSDYAHHPTEINATIAAARSRFPMRRVWCVYEPHQYERLAYLWKEFTQAFHLADVVCILPVFEVAGRERPRTAQQVNSEKLTHALAAGGKQAYHLDSFAHAEEFLRARARPGDVVLLMGAGNIYTLADTLANPPR